MAPTIQYESEKLQEALNLPASERKKIVSQMAIDGGLKSAAYFSAFWWPTLAYLKLQKPQHFFNTKMNVSARTAVAIMPPVLIFTFVSEQIASRLANPNAFLKDIHRRSTLPPWKQYANFVADHPFENLFISSVPLIAYIFKNKLNEEALSLSQRIMHTRVLGQFSVLTLLAINMGFYDYMKKHGKFLEPWEMVGGEDVQHGKSSAAPASRSPH